MSTSHQPSEIAKAEQVHFFPNLLCRLSTGRATIAGGKPLLSTHVLDTGRGVPASGVRVTLYKCVNDTWVQLKESVTEPSGRCADLANPEDFEAARYKLQFKVGKYFEDLKISTMYPLIDVIFDVRDAKDHHHIPLLLSPFGYTTYRGS